MEPVLNNVVTEFSPTVLESPVAAEPPSRAPSKPPPWRTNVYIAIAVAIILSLAAWKLTERRDRSSLVRELARETVTIEHRDFVHICRLTGTVEAEDSLAVVAPQIAGAQLGSLTITKLAPAGRYVKRGDLLVQFDPLGEKRTFLEQEAEYQDIMSQIAEKKADGEIARARDETELKGAENDVKRAQLEMVSSELLSRMDAERVRESLEEAKANLKQLGKTFDLKRLAARADVRTLEIKRDSARENMLHAQHNEKLMTIRSPMNGVVVLNTIWKQGKMGEVQEGDEVQPGVVFMQVVNPSVMQVRVQVNQADLPHLQIGQPAQVRLDAYPGLVFSGELKQLAPIGTKRGSSEKVRTFTALFSIQGSDARLTPDLSAAVDVQLEMLTQALVAPREAVEIENGSAYVMVREPSGAKRTSVTIGPINDNEVVIRSGIQAGVEVLSNKDAGSGEY